ncbi:MAG: (2Fe-2S) ferredoxin domain-containing protein [Aphanocapsa lilacina HA4352-LM1]|jgi:(2Fe-2S) ferredoxin|nr:(2Fe-2S) ferredoxin domain-containing protein [Aphanocapsa lilacina HA4352-LM1]
MSPVPIQIFACQNRTCRRDGSSTVLAALQSELTRCGLSAQVELQATGCLSQCGNGPMLLVVQTATGQQIWYDRVRPEEIPLVVRRHLIEGKPVTDMLYRVKHPKRSFPEWSPLPPPWHTSP